MYSCIVLSRFLCTRVGPCYTRVVSYYTRVVLCFTRVVSCSVVLRRAVSCCIRVVLCWLVLLLVLPRARVVLCCTRVLSCYLVLCRVGSCCYLCSFVDEIIIHLSLFINHLKITLKVMLKQNQTFLLYKVCYSTR